MNKTFKKLTSFALAFAMMLTLMPAVASAANVSNASDNMTRQKISETSDHVITFTPQTTDAGDVVITFDADFDTSGGASGDGTFDTGAGTLTITGGVTSGVDVTATVTGIVNPATPGNRVISIATGADTGEITVPIINDDQIQVTAQVDQTLYFDVRDNIDGVGGLGTDNAVQFGTLTSGAARYATDTGTGSGTPGASSELEAATNAAGGYIIDVTGETLVAMDGSGNDIDGLFTAAISAVGTEQFGINVVKTQNSTGTDQGTINTDYGTASEYHLPDSATAETLVTNTGPASNEIYDIDYLANISSLTPAGNYTTALTFTMTANF